VNGLRELIERADVAEPRQTEIAKEIAGELRAKAVETAWNAADTNTDALPSKQTVSNRFISCIRK
jgi:hypothetical protein